MEAFNAFFFSYERNTLPTNSLWNCPREHTGTHIRAFSMLKTRTFFTYLTGLLTLMTACIFYGILASRLHLPPYTLFMKMYTSLYHEIRENARYISPNLDINALVEISSEKDAERLRTQLIDLIWGHSKKNAAQAASLHTDITDPKYNDHPMINSVNKIVHKMDFGLQSELYIFYPSKADVKNDLVIYHQGHSGDFWNGKGTIEHFLDLGYVVAAASMPLLGNNNQPTTFIEGIGEVKLVNHHQMSFLIPDSGIAIQYFIDPVIKTIDLLTSTHKFDSINMIGLSGGGWTTTLVSAIDTRITNSFSVAGTFPIVLNQPAIGDYEQSLPELYRLSNYLELYVLSATRGKRAHYQIYNKYDPCCFRGRNSHLFSQVINETVKEFAGGEFKVMVDDSHAEHQISTKALDYITTQISQNKM